MNKTDLINRVFRATEGKHSKSEINKILSTALEHVTFAVATGETLTIPGFGTFEPVKRKGRIGRNPNTNEQMFIAARTVPVFRPGKSFKQLVSAAAQDPVDDPAEHVRAVEKAKSKGWKKWLKG